MIYSGYPSTILWHNLPGLHTQPALHPLLVYTREAFDRTRVDSYQIGKTIGPPARFL